MSRTAKARKAISGHVKRNKKKYIGAASGAALAAGAYLGRNTGAGKYVRGKVGGAYEGIKGRYTAFRDARRAKKAAKS